VDLKNTFKIHPKRSILNILSTLQYFNTKRVGTDSPTSYKQGEGRLKKYVQNPSQAFNIDHFSHPAIFEQKIRVETDPPTPYQHSKGGFENYVQNQLPNIASRSQVLWLGFLLVSQV